MAEHDMDGGSAEGTDTNANGAASGNQSDKQPSFDAAKLQSSIDALMTEVGELKARTNGLQSVKDKTTNEVSGLKAKIAEYEQLKEKFGADGALDQMELKQTLLDIKAQLSGSVSPEPAGSGVGGTVNAAQVFSSKGLDVNDPRVAVALNKTYSNATDAELAAYKLKESIQSSPSPTPAQSATPLGSAPVAPDASALKQSYIQEVTAARGNKSLIRGIQQKYQQQGLDPGSVDFRL